MAKQKYKQLKFIAGQRLPGTGPDEEEVSVDSVNAAIAREFTGRRARFRTSEGFFTGRVADVDEQFDGEVVVQVKEVHFLPTIRWIHACEVDAKEQHKYSSIDPSAVLAKHEGYEAFVYACIDGSYQYRGGYRSHLNLSQQEGGFKTRHAAVEDAELWLRYKAAESAKRAVERSARLG